jgi:hypothetical protein
MNMVRREDPICDRKQTNKQTLKYPDTNITKNVQTSEKIIKQNKKTQKRLEQIKRSNK